MVAHDRLTTTATANTAAAAPDPLVPSANPRAPKRSRRRKGCDSGLPVSGIFPTTDYF